MTSTNTGTPGACPDILALRLSGVTPFLSHPDGIDSQLREAHALLLMLASTFETASDVGRSENIGTIMDLNPQVIAAAVEGIATLIALAQFHSDAERALRPSARMGADS